MALMMRLEHESGLVIENAYWKITNVSGDKNYLFVNCEAFLNKEAADAGKMPLSHISQAFKPSVEEGSENFIKQAYLYLKTLPEFEGAIDC
jgi:hypothetical protein